MKTDLFKTEYIKREIEIAKNRVVKSVFDECYQQLWEQEILPGQPEEVPNVNTQETPPEESQLPPEETKPVLQLTKLAVEALFTNLESLNSREVKKYIHDLNDIRPISVADTSKALVLIQNITREAQIPTSNIDEIEKVGFSSKNLLINLIAQCLFLSKDDLLESDPSLGSLMEKVSDDYAQLKELEDKDPIESLKLADQIQENIKKIIPSASLTI
jgi:hypothetical protein